MTPKMGARKGSRSREERGVHRWRNRHWSPFRLHREAQDGPSLSSAQSGESVQIRKMDGGHQFLSRLASLGFTPGAHLEVIQNYGHGPIIVRLRDTRVALGRGEAKKILVQRKTRAEDGS
ncbi:MAG: ferrous iron transport protein A [Anaerolineae bacterium]